MTEDRCPNCEALLTELECFECAWHAMHEIAVRLSADKLAADVIGAAVNEPVNLDAAETRAQLNDQAVTKRSRT